MASRIATLCFAIVGFAVLSLIMFWKILEGISHKIELLDSSSRMKWIILCAFNIYLVFIVSLNSFWLDEAHVALIIRESKNLQGFIGALRFEGTPWLWHFLVYLLYLVIGDAYAALLFLHLLTWILLGFIICYGLRLGAAAAAVVLLSAPSFEYLVNLRQYPFAVLCLLGFAAIVIRWPRSLAAPLALVLLAQTSVNAFFVSVSLFISLLCFFWDDPRLRLRNGALLGVTAIVTLLQLIPDPRIIVGLRQWQLIGENEVDNFIPKFLADISLFGTPAGLLMVFLVLVGVILLARVGAKKDLALLLLPYLLSLAGFLFIIIFKYQTGPRHHFLLPFLVLALLVIGAARHPVPLFYSRLVRLIAVIAVAASLIPALNRTLKLMLRSKTQTENVAAWLHVNRSTPTLLLYHETDCEGVMFYLRQQYRYYSLDRDAFIDRIVWDNEAVDNPRVRGVFRSGDFAKLSIILDQLPPEMIAQQPYLLVTASNLKNGGLPDPFVFQTAHCAAAIQHAFMSPENEAFLVYKITPL